MCEALVWDCLCANNVNFDRVICRPYFCVRTPDNLRKYQLIFTTLGICIDIVEICFGITNGQVLAELFGRHIKVVSYYQFTFFFFFFFFFFFVAGGNSMLRKKRTKKKGIYPHQSVTFMIKVKVMTV